DEDGGNVLDVDAREDLPRLVDALGAALAHGLDRVAARPIDAGKAEDMHGKAVAAMKIEPCRLGGDALATARTGRAQCIAFIDPIAAAIAIDARRREIADPAQPRQRSQIRAMGRKDGIAALAGGHGREEMRRLAEHLPGRGERRLRGEAIGSKARRPKLGAGGVIAAGPGNAPTLGGERPREKAGAVTEPEAEQPVGHSAAA